MYSFGKRSKAELITCHPEIQAVMDEVIKQMDITVLKGYRGRAEQNKAVEEGKSRTPYPQSKHNRMPSDAIDIAPYPIDWEDTERFKDMALIVFQEAAKLGVRLEWGGLWHSLKDMPHFQRLGG